MPLNLLTADISKERMRLLFEGGLVSAEQIIAWADERIAVDSCPSAGLVDLSLALPSKIPSFLACLPPPAEAFVIIRDLYQSGFLSLERSWELVMKTFDRSLYEFPAAGLWEVYRQANQAEEFSSLPDEAKELLHQILITQAAA